MKWWLPRLIALFVLGAVAAILLTLMTFPFWNWFEEQTGIESMGHSGPANWCVIAVYIPIIMGGLISLWRKRTSA